MTSQNSGLRQRLLPDDAQSSTQPGRTLMPKSHIALQRKRRMLVALSITDASILALLYSIVAHPGYVFESSVTDCMIVAFVRLLVLLPFAVNLSVARNGVWQTISFQVVFIGVSLAAGKAISFSWHSASVIAGSILVLSMLLPLCELVLLQKTINVLSKVDIEAEQMAIDEETGLSLGQLGQENEAPKPKLSTSSLLTVLKPYFWPRGIVNKVRCFSTWVFLGLSKVSNLLSPLFLGRAVDLLKKDGANSDVYMQLVLFASSALASKVFKELQNMVYLKVKQTAYTEIAQETFEHVHSLSLEWHLKKKMGNVLRSMDRGVNASNTVVTYIFLYLFPTVGECIAVFAIFYAHFNVPRLSSVTFVAFCLYSMCTVKITLWRKKFREQTNKHDNEYHDRATDSLINYETVKYFTAEDFEVERYVSAVGKYQKYAVNVQLSLSYLNITQQTIIASCSAICLCIAAASDMAIGDFVSVNMYILNLFAPLTFLGSVYNALVQAFVDMSNLSELLAESPDVIDAPGAPQLVPIPSGTQGATVSFEHVSFHYPTQDGKVGITNVSFVAKPGTTTAIVGKTGAGKTTIFRLLFRFYDPLSGRIMISNQDISKVTQRSLRQSIGVVPQDTVLFNDTIRHNVMYGDLSLLNSDAAAKGLDPAVNERIRNACREAQVLDFIESLPEGFDTKVGERGLKLSGGEKQRVAIARAFLKNAPICFLDEGTSALDSVTERSVQSALSTLTSSRTTLVIAHRLSTIRTAEQIMVLGRGKVLETGTHDQLLNAKGVYHSMWYAQLDDETGTTEADVEEVSE